MTQNAAGTEEASPCPPATRWLLSRRRWLGGAAALLGSAALPAAPTAGAAAPARPLILIHGLNGQASVWRDDRNAVVNRLLSLGYRWSADSLQAFSYPLRTDGSGLEDSNGEIATAGLQLARQIMAASQATPGRQVDLLGFSMGGLVGRWAVNYLGRLEPTQRPLVSTLAMLATPNGGADVLTWLGGIAQESQLAVADVVRELLDFDVDSPAAQEMVPGSGFLAGLNAPDASDPRVRYVTIAGRARLELNLRLFGAAVNVGDGLISARSAALPHGVKSSRYELPDNVQMGQEAPWRAISRSAVFHPRLLFNPDAALILATELLPESGQLRVELGARQRAGAIALS